MPDLLTRARLLRQHRRYEEAVSMLHQHLAQNPDDPAAFIELAFNRSEIPGMLPAALEDARRAIGLLPSSYFPLALESRILSDLSRPGEALAAADAALRLAPEEVYAWNSRTLALCGLNLLSEAEESARRGLALAPDEEHTSNLLAFVLRKRNKLDESVAESLRQLGRDAESAFPFANVGWAELHRGHVKEAEQHFKEALRLRPDDEDAKSGLKQAFRARSRLYRWLSRYHYIVIHRPWIMVAQVVAFVVAVLGLGFTGHEKAMFAVILSFVGCYLLYAYFILVAPGLSHFAILLDPIARLSLENREKLDGVFTLLLVAGGVGLMVAGYCMDRGAIGVSGFVLLVTALPLSQFFARTSFWRRTGYLLISLYIFIAGLYCTWQVFDQPDGHDYSGDHLAHLMLCFGTAAIVTLRNCSHIFHRRKED